ncbi:uncharacterized protein LOC128318436 [Pangasianodon hypophthalmus]|uniref:uncharacterized protein LOC128318436 n=1 Tax=Pangasianodon hypophthalmus TaxID=310915 RepID=UPI000F0104CB|nr:uncharacterized protein LOC128318436 [Pangasianodon hypophthalmus]
MLLEEAKSEFKKKNAKIKAVEGHLEAARTETWVLTQWLEQTKDELDMVREELKCAYELKQEPKLETQLPGTPQASRTGSPNPDFSCGGRMDGLLCKASPNFTPGHPTCIEGTARRRMPPGIAPGITPRDLDKRAKNINKFTPNHEGGHDIHAYLQDIDFHLQMMPQVTTRDRLYLLRRTSSLEVRSFLDRQPEQVKADCLLLRKAH